MNSPRPRLFVGNHNYSSWSLRPWLCLRWAGIEFDEELISLRAPGYGRGQIAQVLEVSPTGRVPVLHVGELRLWDSLAIAEWAAELAPEAGLWPEDAQTRALARAVTCEMHSGFGSIRTQMPMNLARRCEVAAWPEETNAEVGRVLELWRGLRARFGSEGPWLFGRRSIADAFYAPVVSRFRTYGVETPDALGSFVEAVLGDADFREWESRPMTDRFDFIDELHTS